jgi:histidinol-phosphate aminotransferase
MEAARAYTLDHLKKRQMTTLPTQANMVMIDWKTTPAPKMLAAFRTKSVEIGRSWPIWPTASRITIGSMADMQNFCGALDAIIA